MSDYKTTIGLEIHAELKTKTKMFCGCLNVPDDKNPNIYVCPICMGHPGTLPVINKEAVKKVLLVGAAIGSQLADFTEFDRKNYFYPDIPKGYQITQYKYPLVSGGTLAGVQLTRIHLEEDTARSLHSSGGNFQFPISNFQSNPNESILNKNSKNENYSLVDFNRAGVPLMELVTEPVMHSAGEVMKFARELQLLLNYLDVSDANMEKGEMRVEVNISVAKDFSTPGCNVAAPLTPGEKKSSTPSELKLGTKVEVKNINSFRAAGKAVEYEYERQTALLERGEKVVQETRGWDENKGVTFSQRSKENAHDYRYFPDPDLPKLLISEIPELSLENLKKSLPELPWEKRERYAKDFGLKGEDIETYVNNPDVAKFFELVADKLIKWGRDVVQMASNYISSDLLGLAKNLLTDKFGKVTPEGFSGMIVMIKNGDISSRGAKDILKVMFENGGSPEEIAKEKGLIQKNDSDELKTIMQKIISDNPKVVEDFKSGKESVLQFFVGQGMKATKGAGNPEVLKSIVLELLK